MRPPIWRFRCRDPANLLPPDVPVLHALIRGLAEFEKLIPDLPRPPMDEAAVRKEYGVHPKLNCPDLAAAASRPLDIADGERARAEDALRRTEAQLQQSQKMEAVGRLVAAGVKLDLAALDRRLAPEPPPPGKGR